MNQATALQGVLQAKQTTSMQFNSDSYLMGVDEHALYCMANRKDQFNEDLKLVEGDYQVDGIGSGIAIKRYWHVQIKFRRQQRSDTHHKSTSFTLCDIPQEGAAGSPSVGCLKEVINRQKFVIDN